MTNEQHLQDIIRKQKNTICFLEKEVERLKFELAKTNATNSLKVIDPIFLETIKN